MQAGKRNAVDSSEHAAGAPDIERPGAVGKDKDGVMVMMLNDCTEGPTEVSSYHIKIVKGDGLKNSVYKTLKQHAEDGKWYFESVTSGGFYGLLDEDDSKFDWLVEDFALFIETHMIPANRMGTGLVGMPDMSKIKFVVNYTLD